jgi:cell division protein FtsL
MAVLSRTLARAQPRSALKVAPVLLGAAALIAVLSLIRVLQTSEATTAAFSMQQLEQEKVELEASVRQIEAEVAGLSSLERVEREAQRMGLLPPVARQSVTINVPWPEQDGGQLPSRFAPRGESADVEETSDSSWWDDVVDALPFN